MEYILNERYAFVSTKSETAGALAIHSVNICKAFGYTAVCLAFRIRGVYNETSYCQGVHFHIREPIKLFSILVDRSEPGLPADKESLRLEGDFPQKMSTGLGLRCDWL